MNQSNKFAAVKEIELCITNILKSSRPELAFEASNDLIEDGLLDSFDIVMLIAELEKEFKISIPGDQILPENFTSIPSIALLVIQLQMRDRLNEG
jgi:acyl carrier protein